MYPLTGSSNDPLGKVPPAPLTTGRRRTAAASRRPRPNSKARSFAPRTRTARDRSRCATYASARHVTAPGSGVGRADPRDCAAGGVTAPVSRDLDSGGPNASRFASLTETCSRPRFPPYLPAAISFWRKVSTVVSRSFTLETEVSGGTDPRDASSGPVSSQPPPTLGSLASAMLKWNRQIQRPGRPALRRPRLAAPSTDQPPIGSSGMSITDRSEATAEALAQVSGVEPVTPPPPAAKEARAKPRGPRKRFNYTSHSAQGDSARALPTLSRVPLTGGCPRRHAHPRPSVPVPEQPSRPHRRPGLL